MSTLQSQRVRRIPNPPMLEGVALLPGMDGTIDTYVIFVEATQSFEAFTLYAPNLAAGLRAPMLTAFHAYGVSWLGIKQFSELLPEAIQRGWFLVAPWQRTTAASANISYANVPSGVQALMEQAFGGTPAAVPYGYQRSSVIELDAAGALIPGGQHMGINLESVPVQSWYNTHDLQVYLRGQTVEFDRYLDQLPSSQSDLVTVTTMLSGWATAPGVVERNATTRPADCSATEQTSRWCHDPVSQSILIVESGANPASWLILP
ncbi:MAG: hypothetical protein ACJAQ3_000239 [Planctomycetota bacterium]|jgi:hypothetical protein